MKAEGQEQINSEGGKLKIKQEEPEQSKIEGEKNKISEGEKDQGEIEREKREIMEDLARHRERLKQIDTSQPLYNLNDEDLYTVIRCFGCAELSRPKFDPEKMAKLRTHLKQVEESEGYDVDFDNFPGRMGSLVNVEPLRVDGSADVEKFLGMAKLAIKQYNKENRETKYVIGQVLTVNMIVSRYRTYLLTFTAHDVKAGGNDLNGEKTFQAAVLVDILRREKDRVAECKLKA